MASEFFGRQRECRFYTAGCGNKMEVSVTGPRAVNELGGPVIPVRLMYCSTFNLGFYPLCNANCAPWQVTLLWRAGASLSTLAFPTQKRHFDTETLKEIIHFVTLLDVSTHFLRNSCVFTYRLLFYGLCFSWFNKFHTPGQKYIKCYNLQNAITDKITLTGVFGIYAQFFTPWKSYHYITKSIDFSVSELLVSKWLESCRA